MRLRREGAPIALRASSLGEVLSREFTLDYGGGKGEHLTLPYSKGGVMVVLEDLWRWVTVKQMPFRRSD